MKAPGARYRYPQFLLFSIIENEFALSTPPITSVDWLQLFKRILRRNENHEIRKADICFKRTTVSPDFQPE